MRNCPSNGEGEGITVDGMTWDQHFKRLPPNRKQPSRVLSPPRSTSTALTIKTRANVD
jgi:hypothetical protein